MKYFLICIVLLILSCNRVKDLTTKTTVSETSHDSKESTYIEKKDTTFNYRPAPEKSQNKLTADSSFLETSLAFSWAIWCNGVLSHNIENKPTIPIRVPAMINFKTLIIRDTVTEYLELTDDHTVTVEKFRFLNAFFYYSGIAFWIIALTLIAAKTWKIIKLRRK